MTDYFAYVIFYRSRAGIYGKYVNMEEFKYIIISFLDFNYLFNG